MPAYRLVCLLLLAAVLMPGASAFATRQEALTLSYEADAAPVFIATGELSLTGRAAGGLGAFGIKDVRLTGIPTLTILQRTAEGFEEKTFRDATLLLSDGALIWSFPEAASLGASQWDAGYGIAFSLPQSPLPTSDGSARGAGFLVGGPDLQIAGRWSGAQADLLLLDAVVTIRDAEGRVEPGWQDRRVNAGVRASDASAENLDVLFRVEGGFPMAGAAALVAGTAAGSDLSMAVKPAARDRFVESLDMLERVGVELARDPQAGPFGPDNPLRALAQFSPVLNGAVLVVAQPDASGAVPEPTVARLGDADFDAGPMSLLRGEDMRVGWSDERVGLQGTPVLAISRSGVAVDEPASVGFVPVISVILWLLAAGAIVFFFVRRPPKADAPWLLRLGSIGVHVLVFAVVFWLWDGSFHETFGTSVLTQVAESGFADTGRLGTTFALQMLPWGLAALFFALPVRILAGVGLRYVGKGKAFKGVANAAGLVSLAIFGPLYAMWFVDFVVRELVTRMG